MTLKNYGLLRSLPPFSSLKISKHSLSEKVLDVILNMWTKNSKRAASIRGKFAECDEKIANIFTKCA